MGDIGTKNYDDKTDRSGKINRPTMGNWDGRQHIGEGGVHEILTSVDPVRPNLFRQSIDPVFGQCFDSSLNLY